MIRSRSNPRIDWTSQKCGVTFMDNDAGRAWRRFFELGKDERAEVYMANVRSRRRDRSKGSTTLDNRYTEKRTALLAKLRDKGYNF